MDRKIIDGSLLFIAALFSFAIVLFISQTNTASSAGGRFDLVREDTASDTGATTTPNYLQQGTSTLAFPSANTDHIDLNLQYTASTTDSTLQFVVEHSDNNIDWYCEAAQPVTSTGTTTVHTYGAKCAVHSWTPGVAGISRRSVALTDLGTRFMRVRFNTKDGNGSLYAQAIKRQPN